MKGFIRIHILLFSALAVFGGCNYNYVPPHMTIEYINNDISIAEAEFITIPEDTIEDAGIPEELISLISRHFEAIENGDLATFRATLAAQDMIDVHHHMSIIHRYFGDIIGVDSAALGDAIAEGNDISEISYAFFEKEFPTRNRGTDLFVKEMVANPDSDIFLKVTTINNESEITVYWIMLYRLGGEWLVSRHDAEWGWR